jgi:hypothetical protein
MNLPTFRWIVFSFIVVLWTPSYADESTIHFDAAPSALPPVYVQEDEAGNLFSINLSFDPESRTYMIERVYLSEADIAELEAAGLQVAVLPVESGGEGKDNLGVTGVSGNCPLPANFIVSANSSGTI